MKFPRWVRSLGRRERASLNAAVRALEPIPMRSEGRAPLKISPQAMAASKKSEPSFAELFPRAPTPGWVGATQEQEIALDNCMTAGYQYAQNFSYGEGLAWPGFPYLAELTQRPEYRLITNTRAKEMTRKWIDLTYAGDEKNDELLSKLEKAMERFKVRDVFALMAEHDGFYGRGQLYIDTGATDKPKVLASPLVINERTIPKGSLKGFIPVEPFWSYPGVYNSTDPLKKDFYVPKQWWVMNKTVHHTRLLTMISAEIPDMLKAAYAFSGLSLSQQAKPYVDNWLRTRQSVSDITHSFSIVVLKTLMQSTLAGDSGEGLFRRVDLFNATRDNRGAMVIDKETEDMDILAAPIAGLHELQAQAQEQMCSISQTPAVKLLGIQPSGLNASSDGEIRVWYDNVHAMQEHLFGASLKKVLDIIQLNETGKIDPNVGFEFVSLWELDEAAEASVEKTEADTDAILIQEGVISPEEARRRIANKPKSAYAGLDPDDLPEPPESDLEMSPQADPAKALGEPKSEQRSGV